MQWRDCFKARRLELGRGLIFSPYTRDTEDHEAALPANEASYWTSVATTSAMRSGICQTRAHAESTRLYGAGAAHWVIEEGWVRQANTIWIRPEKISPPQGKRPFKFLCGL